MPNSRSRQKNSSSARSLAAAVSRVTGQDRRRGGHSVGHAHDGPGSRVTGHSDACAAGLTDAVGCGTGYGRGRDGGEGQQFCEMHDVNCIGGYCLRRSFRNVVGVRSNPDGSDRRRLIGNEVAS